MGLSLGLRSPGPHNLMSMRASHNDRWTLKGNFLKGEGWGAQDRGELRDAWRSLAHIRLRPLGRLIRKYLKITSPSPAGNGKPHFRQEIVNLERDDLIFRFARWAAEVDWF